MGIHFPIQLELRIDWSEMDLFGHVNNVSFFKYVQASRVNVWEQMGLLADWEATGTGPLLASCKCDFRRPLHYPGRVHIGAGVKAVGNTSFVLRHHLLDAQGEIAAEAEDVIVLFDYRQQQKVVLPETWREQLHKIMIDLPA